MLEPGVAWNAEFMAPYVRAISPYTFLEFQCEEVRAVGIDHRGSKLRSRSPEPGSAEGTCKA